MASLADIYLKGGLILEGPTFIGLPVLKFLRIWKYDHSQAIPSLILELGPFSW